MGNAIVRRDLSVLACIGAYGENVGFLQFRIGDGLAFYGRSTVFSFSVCYIFRVGACEQMRWIAAWGIITGVEAAQF